MLYLHMMVPDFFAAGHIHYAKYITCHIVELATSVPKQAMTVSHLGQHVYRHKPGSWDVVVSDQSGAQTYIWYEKARGGGCAGEQRSNGAGCCPDPPLSTIRLRTPFVRTPNSR